MKTLKDVEVGDKVWIDGDSGFCQGGEGEVTDVRFKYDENTGEKYKVICCGTHHFDSRCGHALTPPYAYYVTLLP